MQMINEAYPKQFKDLPEKVLQFGEGNFLRAFVDWMIELSNREGKFNGSVVLCQPIANGLAPMLNAQDCQYTVIMRGMENGEPTERIERISSVSRCINPYEDYEALLAIARSKDLQVIVSNTTEAGIAYHEGDKADDRPPVSYPAKLCAFLYERFKAFDGAADKGLLILPVELIDNNGAQLKKLVLRYASEWALGEGFEKWLKESCEFTSTLVDRIVTGYPRDDYKAFEERIGYTDKVLDTCEIFNLWVIEGNKKWAEIFPVGGGQANVVWTDDVTPYKKRKVRILNGAHTSTVLAAFLGGHDIVLELMNDPTFKTFMNNVLQQEVIPTLDLPKQDLKDFAEAVNDRFSNPYVRHRLLDISLNSCSKFAARCLPSLMEYIKREHAIPKHLCFSLAAFILFYRGSWEDGKLMGKRAKGDTYEIRDDKAVLDFFGEIWKTDDAAKVVHAVMSNADFWGEDLTNLDGLEDEVTKALKAMMDKGVNEAAKELVG